MLKNLKTSFLKRPLGSYNMAHCSGSDNKDFLQSFIGVFGPFKILFWPQYIFTYNLWKVLLSLEQMYLNFAGTYR